MKNVLRDALVAIAEHSDGAPDDYAHEIARAALETEPVAIVECPVCAGRDGTHGEGCQFE